MKIRLFLLLSAVFLFACKPASESSGEVEAHSTEQSPLNTVSATVEQPMPAKRPHEMTLHGHTRVDEYFWLRDDTRKDPEVIAYLEEDSDAGKFMAAMKEQCPHIEVDIIVTHINHESHIRQIRPSPLPRPQALEA